MSQLHAARFQRTLTYIRLQEYFKMRLIHFLFLFIIVSSASASDRSDLPDFSKGRLFKVVGVDADDVLNLRAEPGPKADIVASLSSRAFSLISKGDQKKVDGGEWVKVDYQGVSGWVNSKFLEAEAGIELTREELFDLGISVAYGPDMDRGEIPPGYAEGPQQKNQCPFPESDYTVSVSDSLLEHFKGRGFSLETLCLGLTAPIAWDPETGFDVPFVEVGGTMHLSVLLNLPSCLKNGTPLLDCRINYDWFWGRDESRNPESYAKIGKELDAIIRHGIANGEIKNGPIDDLETWWNRSPILQNHEIGMYVGFCDVSPRYPRGYACALSTKRFRGDGWEGGNGSLQLWSDVTTIKCVKDATCTPTSIFFGTVRKIGNSALRVSFTKDRNEKLTLGRALVTVPKAHKRGKVTRPSWSDLLSFHDPYAEDGTRHFTIPPGGVILYPNEAAFISSMSSFVRERANFKDHAVVFVHGFNVSFEDALYRTAQLTYDLGENGLPFGTAFLFSWPSAGDLRGYLYDSDSARNAWAIAGLVRFLRLVADKSGAKQIHVIAHSMGNLPLLEAMDEIAKTESKEKFAQVVFAAPDVDNDEFRIIAQRIHEEAKGFTLYASSNDRAMEASREVRLDTPRAGDVTAAGPLIVKGVDTIDASDVSLEYFSLRHSEYAESKALLDDLVALLIGGVRPPDLRSKHFAAQSIEGGKYWKWQK